MTISGSRVIYQRESFAEAWADAGAMPERHYAELAQFPDIAFEPNLPLYEQSERQGQLRIYTARLTTTAEAEKKGPAGVMIGYAVFTLQYGLHSHRILQAHGQATYIAPEHRHRGWGIQLMQFAEGHLRMEGVQLVCYHAKPDHDDFKRVMAHLEYPLLELTFGKRL